MCFFGLNDDVNLFFGINFEHKINLSCIFIFLFAFAFKFFESLFVTFQFNFINLKNVVDCNKMHGRLWSNLVSDIIQWYPPNNIYTQRTIPFFTKVQDHIMDQVVHILIVVTMEKKYEYLPLKKKGLTTTLRFPKLLEFGILKI